MDSCQWKLKFQSIVDHSNANGKLETRTKGIVDKCSDLTCTKKYALTEGPKRGGGVNVGHSIAQPPQSFYACYGACNLNNKAQNELMTSRIRVLFLNFF